MAKILVVEDDTALNRTVCAYLTKGGHEPSARYNAMGGLKALEERAFDLIVSDVMMPGMDGFEFARTLRKSNKTIPILFMTALSDKPSKQQGFQPSLDDYVVKPFDEDELVQRVNATLRRAKIENSNRLSVGNLTMDRETHTAHVDGAEIALTTREFNVLFQFLSNPKRTFTRVRLLEQFWEGDSSATLRTVDAYMTKLQGKTTRCTGFTLTAHALGYRAVLK